MGQTSRWYVTRNHMYKTDSLHHINALKDPVSCSPQLFFLVVAGLTITRLQHAKIAPLPHLLCDIRCNRHASAVSWQN